jgi:hypothetical protein
MELFLGGLGLSAIPTAGRGVFQSTARDNS